MNRIWRNGGGAIRVAVLVGIVALLGAACGGSDDKKTPSGSASATTPPAKPAAESGPYCTKTLAIETVPEPDIDFEALTPDQQRTEVKKFVTEKVVPLADDIGKVTPQENKANVDKLIAAVHQVALDGDFMRFQQPDIDAAGKSAHAFDLKTCGWARTDVAASEYSFGGVPPTLKPGATSLELTNRGAQKHEMRLLRINDDVNDPIADIVKLPRTEMRKKTKSLGGDDEVDPGKTNYVVADLKPGRYALACFLTIGDAKDAPTHASKGMASEFKVS